MTSPGKLPQIIHLLWVIIGIYILCDGLDAGILGPCPRQPYGLRMCRQLCQQFTDCFTYAFRQPDHFCQVTGVKLNSESLREDTYIFNVSKFTKPTNGNISCPRSSRLLKTRRRSWVCLSLLERNHPQEEGRLLLLSFGGRKVQHYQMSILNSYMRPYNFLQGISVMRAAYLNSSKKLILITTKHSKMYPTSLLFVPLDSNDTTIIEKTCAFCAIAVDDPNNMVFLSVASRFVARMDLASGNISKVFKQKVTCHMVVDTKRKKVYTLTTTSCRRGDCAQLRSFSYDDKNPRGILVMKMHMISYMFPADDAIYYTMGQVKTQILKMFLNVRTMIYVGKTLSYRPLMFVKHADNIYVSKFQSSAVDIVSEKGQLTTVYNTYSNTNNGIIIVYVS